MYEKLCMRAEAERFISHVLHNRQPESSSQSVQIKLESYWEKSVNYIEAAHASNF